MWHRANLEHVEEFPRHTELRAVQEDVTVVVETAPGLVEREPDELAENRIFDKRIQFGFQEARGAALPDLLHAVQRIQWIVFKLGRLKTTVHLQHLRRSKRAKRGSTVDRSRAVVG